MNAMRTAERHNRRALLFAFWDPFGTPKKEPKTRQRPIYRAATVEHDGLMINIKDALFAIIYAESRRETELCPAKCLSTPPIPRRRALS